MPISESSQIVKAVKKVLPSVVSITMSKNMQVFETVPNLFGFGFAPTAKRKKVKLGGGSGFIVSKDGIILTNRHVIEDNKAEFLVVTQDGKTYPPKVLAKDPINDIAILKIDLPKTQQTKLTTVSFADSSKLDLGQTVVAIGNALGLFKNTVSTGVVSGLSREIKAQSDFSLEKTRLRGLIQTDAAINPGNSGGPLIDLLGNAIGINAAMVFGAENIGFALPINNAKKDLDEVKKYGRLRQPFLGVRYLPINQILKKQFNLPVNCGALIVAEPNMKHGVKQAVVPNSPAAKAGLKEADIILELRQKKISPELSIGEILQDCQIGETLSLKVLRKGKEKRLKIILAEKT